MLSYATYYLSYLWALPNTLIGLLLALPYGAHGWRWRDGVLEVKTRRIIGNPWGQTWGWLIYWADAEYRGVDVSELGWLQRHERAHVHQSCVGGVFFLIAYAACFVWLYFTKPKNGWSDWRTAYRAIPFERAARAAEWR